MEWPVSGGPAPGASCLLRRRSARDAWELMRTAAAGKPPRRRGGAAAARGLAGRRGTEVLGGVRAGPRGLGSGEGSAAPAALPLAGDTRSRRWGRRRRAIGRAHRPIPGGLEVGEGTGLGAERAEPRSGQLARQPAPLQSAPSLLCTRVSPNVEASTASVHRVFCSSRAAPSRGASPEHLPRGRRWG